MQEFSSGYVEHTISVSYLTISAKKASNKAEGRAAKYPVDQLLDRVSALYIYSS